MTLNLAFTTGTDGLDVIRSPARVTRGPWTVLASADRHSQTTAEQGLQRLLNGGGLEAALLPVRGLVVGFDARTRTVHVATSASPGSRLHYTEDSSGTWVYATELPTLLRAMTTKPSLDVAGLLEVPLLVPRSAPPLVGVRTLDGGMRLTQRVGNSPMESRWFHLADGLAEGSVEQWVQRYCALIDDIARLELPESGDVAALMSAGLDSSMVVGTAAGQLSPGQRITAMCLDPDPEYTRSASSNWAATDFPDALTMGRMWDTVDVEPLRNPGNITPLESSPHIMSVTGMPLLNPTNAVWMWLAQSAARESGQHDVLHGQSGNLSFSWNAADAVLRMLRSGKPGQAIHAIQQNAEATGRSSWRALGSALAPLRRRVRHRLVRPPGDRDRREALMASSLAPMIKTEAMDELRLWDQVGRTALAPNGTEGRTWQPGHLRPEYRFAGPLVDTIRDVDLLAAGPLRLLVSALPPAAFVGEGANRSFARRAMRGRVPDRIRLRRQRGRQAVDAQQWYMAHANLRENLMDLAQSSLVHEVIDVDRWLSAMPDESTPVTVGFDRTLGTVLYMNWYEDLRTGPTV